MHLRGPGAHAPPFFLADPARQFDLVRQHVQRIRSQLARRGSRVTVFVERNLGFEVWPVLHAQPGEADASGKQAEHHKRALEAPGTAFYVDRTASRVGVQTTEATKHAMMQLVVVMLRERRLHMADPLVSNDPKGMRVLLREQMETYGIQVKLAANTFQKERIALSGKVGGMRDDICICLQLACYFTQLEAQRAAQAVPGAAA